MKPESKETDKRGKPGTAPGEGCESLLRAEIAFWRELLSDCDHSVPPESIERMRQALALAEQRFLQVCQHRQAEAALHSGPLRACMAGGKVLH
jgi:hypothetical protein